MQREQVQAKLDVLTKQLEEDIATFESETKERVSGINLTRGDDWSLKVTVYLLHLH